MARRRDPGAGDPPAGVELSGEDRRLWARVTGAVTPAQRRKPLRIVVEPGPGLEAAAPDATRTRPRAQPRPPVPTTAPPPSPAPAPERRPHGAPDVLEPRRQRRLSRERDPIEARIDLHGFGRFQAEDALKAFLIGAQARGLRAVLVVTGQGRRGGVGVIRASAPEWLRAPALRGVVSGFAQAHRRHGGDGALYVTLRRPGG